jgi:hypothetical protein
VQAVLWTAQGPRYLRGGSGDDRASSPSQRHLELLHNGRLTARYLSPLVDSLLAGNGSQVAEHSAAEAPQRT